VPYRITIGSKYKKQLRRVTTPEHIARIRDEYADILADPYRETKPLKGELGLSFRYRRIVDTTPQYRILFAVFGCELEQGVEPPFCLQKYCEVGREISEDEIVGWVDPEDDSASELVPAEVFTGQCKGLVKFALFGTREFFTNFYNLPLKQQLKLL